jgi:hypothetical protein
MRLAVTSPQSSTDQTFPALEKRAPTPTFRALSPVREPVHVDLRPRPGDDSRLVHVLGACRRARMAPRPDASTGYWRLTKHRVTQGRWTGNTGRTAENVVREMDPDAVVREAEIGRSLAGDDSDTVRRAVIFSDLGRLKSFFLSYDYY